MKYGKGEDVNETTMKLIHWIWSEPDLADFLRDVAEGDAAQDGGEFGDRELSIWLSDLLGDERNGIWWDVITSRKVDLDRLNMLRAELTDDRGRLDWLDEMDAELIRNALLGQEGGGEPVYVHALQGLDPRDRYRVHSASAVRERSGAAADRLWYLPERNRQLCPEPIGAPCSCTVERKEKKR